MLLLALLLTARADEPPADARAAEALSLMQAGNPNQAILIFESIVDRDTGRVDAWDGLIRARLAAGDAEGAARAADARLKRRPDDEAFARWRFYVLGLAPSRRAEAVLGWQAIVAVHPEDAEAWRNLATFLSWSPGRLPEAVGAWRSAVAAEPSVAARLGLARTLAWSGENAEAAVLFDQLLAEDPKNVDALLGRSQLARWTGDRRTARALLERAEALAPTDPRLRAERSRLELDSTRRAVARGAAQSAVELSPGLYEGREALAALRDETAARVGGRFTYTTESTGFDRVEVAAPVTLHPLPDTRVRLEPAFARLAWAEAPVSGDAPAIVTPTDVNRVSLGAEVRQTGLPQGLYARGAYRLHVPIGLDVAHAAALEIGTVRPLDLPVELRIGARQRLLVDAPETTWGLAPLDHVGSGGGTGAALLDGVTVREGYAGVVFAPFRGLYVYADAASGTVEDIGRTSVAAGLGQDVVRLLGRPSAHALVVKYDAYYLSAAASDARWFSPSAYLTHTPGLEWRWSPGRVTVGVEGGVPLRADAPIGWLVGAHAGVRIGKDTELAARFRAVDDTAWRATGLTLAFAHRF